MNEAIKGGAMDTFIGELDGMIRSRKKMTSPLYQVVLGGEASIGLLRQFVINRFPIKNFWTRNILGIASRIDEYQLRRELVENIYEEETGMLSNSRRHMETFIRFGKALGLNRQEITDAEWIPETREMVAHNVGVCNNADVHFINGVASVLLLMEGQPPITNLTGRSMESVMRDVYGLPQEGYEYFTHHASSSSSDGNHVSELEDDHAGTAREILRKYCVTDALRDQAKANLAKAIDLRHRHFQAIHDRFHVPGAEAFRWRSDVEIHA